MSETGESILVVEDDEGVGFLQSQALTRAGFSVTLVGTADDAIAQLADKSFDLAILDYRLPGLETGLDLYARMKEKCSDVPVIFVTGYSDEETVIKALRAGASDFVTKSREYLEYLPEAAERVLHKKRLEKQLEQRDAQLRQAQKMEAIGTLAGGVAHEFNNLLQAIQGYTQYALEGMEETDERHTDLQQVLKASERASMLTRQLLGFSRREVLQLTNLDLNELVRDLIKMLRPLIGANIEIETTLSEKVGVVHADAGHLQQLLMNLCVNARDAMPHGGRLIIKTQKLRVDEELSELRRDLPPGNYVVLSVTDTGCGMPAEVRERIFEPFFTTKGVGKGTGLGLPMVYGIVRQHKGTIRVYSEIGLGTTFRIYLPIIGNASIESYSTETRQTRGGNETILVSETDSPTRDLAVRTLQRAGYHTITASNGQEAVERFEENRDSISLALLDVVMPRLGGREVYLRIKSSKPQTQVVFCSGYDPDVPEIHSLTKEARIVQKPFDPVRLLEVIRDALDEALCLTN